MIEKLPDELDAASQQESLRTAASIRFVQALLEPQTHPEFDGETCLSCGDDIPTARLEAGRIRCTPCETALELKRKHFK